MVTANYATAAAKETAQPFLFFTIAGLGHGNGAGDAGTLTRFSTWEPPSSYTGYAAFKEYITGELPRVEWDTLSPTNMSVDSGTFEGTLLDVSAYFTARLAHLQAPISATGTANERPTLALESIARSTASTNFDVTDASGVTVGAMIFIDNEAMHVTARDTVSSPNTLTVNRAQWDTSPSAHANGSEIRSTPLLPRGLRVRVYRNFRDLTSADENQIWTGSLRDVRQGQGEDCVTWTVSAVSVLMDLDVECMRRRGRFKVESVSGTNPDAITYTVSPATANIDEDLFADTTQNIYLASSDAAGVMPADKGSATQEPRQLTVGSATALRPGMANVDEWLEGGGNGDTTISEAAPVDIGLGNTRFGWKTGPGYAGSLVKTHHPFLIALNWILSTGGTGNRTSPDNDYDQLPDGWGAELDVEFVDYDSFEQLAEHYPLDVSNLMYGVGDEGFNLRQHLEEELLGPYGVFVAQNGAGKLALHEVAARPAWRTGSSTTVDHDALTEIPSNETDFSEAITGFEIKTGYRWDRQKNTITISALKDNTPAWRLRAGRSVGIELRGYRHGAEPVLLRTFATAFLRKAMRIAPTLTAPITDNYEHLIQVGDPVLVTSAILPDLANGSVGVTSAVYVCIGKQATGFDDLSVTLYNIAGSLRPGSIAPALKVTVVNSTTDFDVSQNAFTTSGGEFSADGFDDDVDWFDSAADYVMVIDGDSLEPKSSAEERVITVTSATNVTIASAFTTAPVAGDYLVFIPYDSANATTNQKKFAHYASNGQIGSSNDAPYVYVG